METIIFLDLEDTVIDDWSKQWSAEAVNTEKVKEWIASINPDRVRLFSYAMWTDHCIKDFETMYQKWLSRLLDVEFDMEDCFTTAKLYEMASRSTWFEDEQECLIMYGKDYGFQWYIQKKDYRDCVIYLLDDVIEDKTIHYPKKNLTVHFVNVTTL